MIERVTNHLLQTVLSSYFESDASQSKVASSVWSGFVRLTDLKLRAEKLNDKLQFVRVVSGHISKLEITIPWSKLGTSDVIVVIEGLHILLETDFGNIDQSKLIEKRRRKLKRASPVLQQKSWTEYLKARLSEGVLQKVAKNLQVHFRDIHVRLEHEKYATGAVIEGLHIQNETDASDTIKKLAVLNHFGLYWNAVGGNREHMLLKDITYDQVTELLDQMIPRRGTSITKSPKHTYLLQPIDASLILEMSKTLPAHLSVTMDVPDVTVNLRDFQIVHGYELVYRWKEYKYLQRLRIFRPSVPPLQNPRAWWLYAYKAVRRELRVRRFTTCYRQRKRYCDLYERKLRSADDAAGSQAWTMSDANELQEMEDGIQGDLLVEDIILYRILVNMRVGRTMKSTTSSWILRTMSSMRGDNEIEEDYERLLEYWKRDEQNGNITEYDPSEVALSINLVVQTGRVVLFSPLLSTNDQPEINRLHERFLELTYSGFNIGLNLMGNMETIHTSILLKDFIASELRKNRSTYAVLRRCSKGTVTSDLGEESEPLISVRISKFPKHSDGCEISLESRILKVEILLVPDSEYIACLIGILRPIPQFKKAAKNWTELSIATINSWASSRIAFLAKTAVVDNKSIDLDIRLSCPVVRLGDGNASEILCDLGSARIKTVELAGVADSKLLRKRPRSESEVGTAFRSNASYSTTIPTGKYSHGRNSRGNMSIHDNRDGDLPNRFEGSTRLDSFEGDFATFGHYEPIRLLGVDDFDFVFYDIYEIQINAMRLSMIDKEISAAISSPIDLTISLHKSVIPDDHTLCRIKCFCSVSELKINLSQANLAQILCFSDSWMSHSSTTTSFDIVDLLPGNDEFPVLVTKPAFHNDDSPHESIPEADFDEEKFFDALESKSCVSDNLSDLVDDQWMTEGESVLGSDNVSVIQSLRSRRKRQASISEVSSLSGSSANRGNRRFKNDDQYLNADNLAKLDEDAEDNLNENASEDSKEASFQSAISPSQIAALIADVNVNTEELEHKIKILREELKAIEDERNVDQVNQVQRFSSKKRLVHLETKRLIAQLRALKASRADLLSLVGNAAGWTADQLSEIDAGHGDDVNFSVKKASMLVRQQRRNGDDSISMIEHNLTQNLRRDLAKFVFAISDAQVTLVDIGIISEMRKDDATSVTLRVTDSTVVLRRDVTSMKCFFTIESARIFLDENPPKSLLMGGRIDEPNCHFLPSIFPRYLSSATEEVHFIRGSIVARNKITTDVALPRIFHLKGMFSFGGIEITPQEKAVKLIKTLTDLVRTKSIPTNRTSDEAICTSNEKVLNRFDLSIQSACLRINLSTEGSSVQAAAALTEFDVRLVGSYSEEDFRDRSQLDFRIGNVQLMWSDCSENEMCGEVLGKREIYVPLLKARLRCQKVLKDSNGGWVVGDPVSHTLPNHKPNSDHGGHETTWNAHLGCRVESLGVELSPESLEGMKKCIYEAHAILKCLHNHRHLSKMSHDEEISLPSLRFHWRVDFSARHASITLLSSALEYIKSEPDQSLTLSYSVALSIDQVLCPQSGADVQIRVEDLSIRRASDGFCLIDPLCSNFLLRVPASNSIFSGHTRKLEVPDDYEWKLFGPVLLDKLEDNREAEIQLSVSGKISNLTIHATPHVSALCRSLLSRYSNAIRGSHLSQSSSTRRQLGPKHSLAFKFRLDLSAITLNVEQERRMQMKGLSEVILAVTVREVHLQVVRRISDISCSFFMNGLLLDDYSCKNGVRVLRGEGGAGRTMKSFISMHAERTYKSTLMDLEGTLEINVGHCRILVLPSVISCLIHFKREIDNIQAVYYQHLPGGIIKPETRLSPRISRCNVSMSISIIGLESVLPTKDLVKYVRDGLQDDVNVVILRSSCDFTAKITTGNQDEFIRIIRFTHKDHPTTDQIFSRLIGGMKRSEDVILTGKTRIRLMDFQILRTRVRKTDSIPHCFEVSLPSGEEQRVTNPFWLILEHDIVSSKVIQENGQIPTWHLAQSIDVNAGFIDILVNICQSSSGVKEAFLVTIKPIVDMLKTKEKVSGSELADDFSLVVALKRDPTVVHGNIDGVKLTFVPGGVNGLTESAILKLSLADIHWGSGILSLPAEVELPSQSNLRNVPASHGVTVLHMILGTWLKCELSANYHNRRLVAWEPLLEPWKFHVTFGVDLVRAFKVDKLQDHSGSVNRAHNQTTPNRKTDSKFSVARLLRSPFRGDADETKCQSDDDRVVHDAIDFCYVYLVCFSDIVTKSIISDNSKTDTIYSTLPNIDNLKWLVQFGYPSITNVELPLLSQPALAVSISDVAPLRLNVTGAFLDHILQFVNEESNAQRFAPHWIRNHTGLTIRFQEVLDFDPAMHGEHAAKVVLLDGSEIPLSLKRSSSQSCDPHSAFIVIELGNFEDVTVSRTKEDMKDSESGVSIFTYKVSSKVAVDTVGVHRYDLEWNETSHIEGHHVARSLGSLIVRVVLRGGIKFVSVESPLTLRNTSDRPILCEVRRLEEEPAIWRSVLPSLPSSPAKVTKNAYVAVPVDLVPFLGKSHTLVGAALPRKSTVINATATDLPYQYIYTKLPIPPPYSKSSLGKGLIAQKALSLDVWNKTETLSRLRPKHFDICHLRIGTPSFDLYEQGRPNNLKEVIPEQRMLIIRAPIVLQNFLAQPIAIQVRTARRAVEPLLSLGMDEDINDNGWEDLGRIDCGNQVSWNGVIPSSKVEARIRLLDCEGRPSQQFPYWSNHISIPPELGLSSTAYRTSVKQQPLQIVDIANNRLDISVSLIRGGRVSDENANSENDIRSYAEKLDAGNRAVSFFSCFFVVDSTGLELEYKSRGILAGQMNVVTDALLLHDHETSHGTFGLAELVADSDLMYLPPRMAFKVLMMGEESTTGVNLRRRPNRFLDSKGQQYPWSEPLPLTMGENGHYDFFVQPSSGHRILRGRATVSEINEPFALRSRIVSAPRLFGGHLGTRIIHIVCRYAIVNELGREIEILSRSTRQRSLLIKADGRPRPFHLDDTEPIRLRPKGFGWLWSGKVHVTPRRREVVLRLKHSLKGRSTLITVEFHANRPTGTCIILIKGAAHPSYRLENNTMHTLHYCQISSIFGADRSSTGAGGPDDSIILPFHHAEFAWDEPDYGQNAIIVEIVYFSDTRHDENIKMMLGRFNMDRIAPGTEFKLPSNLLAQVEADGPTRVLRIIEPQQTSPYESGNYRIGFQSPKYDKWNISSVVHIKLNHGVGISVVNWTPQELIFVNMDDILFEKVSDGTKDTVSFSVGSIIVDNQLFVTPYPVLMRMGRKSPRRQNRKHSALHISWCKSLARHKDLTLFERVDITSEPLNVTIDGSLVSHASDMIREIKGIGDIWVRIDDQKPRDSILHQVLGMHDNSEIEDDVLFSFSEDIQSRLLANDLYKSVDYMATTVTASKLRSRYIPPPSGQPDHPSSEKRLLDKSTLGLSRRKYYVEKLRISNIIAEVSWTGSLPLRTSFLKALQPALTFEGFPIFLRSFTVSHVHGTAEEHIQSLKSHYLSIWRVFDLLVGLFKPGFIIRTWYFTSCDIVSSFFSRMADACHTAEDLLTCTLPQRTGSYKITRVVFEPSLKLNISLTRGLSKLFTTCSLMLRYDPARRKSRSAFARSRNPRLFANVNGKDLLVEYVEGENAGKALLSRVRMGVHLGEGYLYHIENAHFPLWRNVNNVDANALIILLTCERILVLNGQLHANFCEVVWEVAFRDLIFVEIERQQSSRFDILLLWYISDTSVHDYDDENYLRRFVDDSTGLNTLECKRVFVPGDVINSLCQRMTRVKENIFLNEFS